MAEYDIESTTNDIPTNLGSISLVGGATQVTLTGGTGDDSVISGHIVSVDGDTTIVSNSENTQVTIYGDAGKILTNDDSVVTILGGSEVGSTLSSGSTTYIGLDNLQSGNGSPGRPLKRMELVYKDVVVKFAINPSDYTQKEPNRATITQTKGGAWIDAWGAGITEFSLKGITGVSGQSRKNNGVDVGYQRWKELRDLFRGIYQDVQDGEDVTELVKLYNYTDNEFWYCYPTQNGIELYRSRSKPHVYQYSISLWGLRRIGEPETTTGVIGNPYKEQATTTIDTTEQTDTTDYQADETVIDQDPDAYEEGSDVFPSEDNDQDTQTQHDTQAFISGGNAYVTKTLVPGIEADTAIITNTRTKTNAAIREQARDYLIQLAPIIGGHGSQFSPKTAYNCATELQISDAGIVVNVSGFTAKNLNRDATTTEDGRTKYPKLLEELIFAALVSKETYALQQQILAYDTDVLSPEYILPIGSTPRERVMQAVIRSTKLDSTLYRLMVKYQPKYYLSKNDIRYLKIVMLECMMVYRQLSSIYNSTGQISTTLTPTGMRTLIKNIDALVIYLETNTTDTNEFFVRNVMWELRKLEYVIVQVAADIVEYL